MIIVVCLDVERRRLVGLLLVRWPITGARGKGTNPPAGGVCFAKPEDAAAFCEQFGGERFADGRPA